MLRIFSSFFQTKCCTEAVKSKCHSSCGDGPIQHIFHQIQNAVIEFHDSWDVQAISFHPQNIIVITIFRHVFQFPMKLLQTIQFHGTHRVRGKYVDSTSTAANNCLSIAIRLNFQRRTTHILIDISSFH